MIERFLKYSLENGRKISVILSDAQGMKRKNLQVTAVEEEGFNALFPGRKKAVKVPFSSVLTADYARGDHGELE